MKTARLRLLCLLTLLLLVAALAAFRNAGRWLTREDPRSSADIIFVLSGGMPYRAEEAGKVFGMGYAPEVWVSRAESPASERTDVESAPNFDPRLADQSKSDDDGDRKRRRPILARYVFGTELKPGERWKRRLRHVN